MSSLKQLSKDDKEVLCSFGWLAKLSREFQDELLSIGSLKTLKPGDVLYRRGKVSSHAFGLIEGQIDVHLTATNSEELVYPFTAPGRWYGLADVIANEPAFGKATAGTTSKVICFSRKQLLGFLDSDPKRYREIIAHEFNLRQSIQETVIDLVTSDGVELVARKLVRMVEFEGTDLSTPVIISQFNLAAAAGVSVPTIQRAFRQLKKYGVIETSYGRVKVLNIKLLKDFMLSFKVDD
jgi:CRP/FNR family cyclic AMP-dependent transcriptional regulator